MAYSRKLYQTTDHSILQYSTRSLQQSMASFTLPAAPDFPQSNGEAERAVKTVKSLLKKAEDPYMAILTYRSTPLSSGFSPAEILMSRRLCANLPIMQSQLQPSVPDFSLLKAREEERKRNQKRVFDSRHAVHDLKPASMQTTARHTFHHQTIDVHIDQQFREVWVPDHNITGHVIEPIAPRSYHVSIPTG